MLAGGGEFSVARGPYLGGHRTAARAVFDAATISARRRLGWLRRDASFSDTAQRHAETGGI